MIPGSEDTSEGEEMQDLLIQINQHEDFHSFVYGDECNDTRYKPIRDKSNDIAGA